MDFDGQDNYGKPKADYLDRLTDMDDDTLQKESEQKIWLSAYAANNHRSDYHWQCDACWAEAKIRDPEKQAIYVRAYKAVERQEFG